MASQVEAATKKQLTLMPTLVEFQTWAQHQDIHEEYELSEFVDKSRQEDGPKLRGFSSDNESREERARRTYGEQAYSRLIRSDSDLDRRASIIVRDIWNNSARTLEDVVEDLESEVDHVTLNKFGSYVRDLVELEAFDIPLEKFLEDYHTTPYIADHFSRHELADYVDYITQQYHSVEKSDPEAPTDLPSDSSRGTDSPLARGTDSPLARGTDSPLARGTDSPLARGTDSPLARYQRVAHSTARHILKQLEDDEHVGDSSDRGSEDIFQELEDQDDNSYVLDDFELDPKLNSSRECLTSLGYPNWSEFGLHFENYDDDRRGFWVRLMAPNLWLSVVRDEESTQDDLTISYHEIVDEIKKGHQDFKIRTNAQSDSWAYFCPQDAIYQVIFYLIHYCYHTQEDFSRLFRKLLQLAPANEFFEELVETCLIYTRKDNMLTSFLAVKKSGAYEAIIHRSLINNDQETFKFLLKTYLYPVVTVDDCDYWTFLATRTSHFLTDNGADRWSKILSHHGLSTTIDRTKITPDFKDELLKRYLKVLDDY
jgi:hypothetical protein